MFRDRASTAVAGPAFFERHAEALVGTWVVGLRRGASRRVHGRYAGRLGGTELPAGRDRHILIELVDVCYPELRVSGRLHWSYNDGSGSPVRVEPAVSVSGCGATVRQVPAIPRRGSIRFGLSALSDRARPAVTQWARGLGLEGTCVRYFRSCTSLKSTPAHALALNGFAIRTVTH
jgi:hypothetical protein